MTLRSRILLLSTGLTAMVLVLFAVPLAISVKQSATDRGVRESTYVAQGVADYLSTSRYTLNQCANYVKRVNARSDTQITVMLPDGSSVGAKLPASVPTPSPHGADQRDKDGDRDDLGNVSQPKSLDVDDGHVVELMAMSTEGRALVRAYIANSAINKDVYERWAWIVGGGLALIALSAGCAELVSKRLTKPLVATAATAEELSAGNLDARAPVRGAQEVALVATALNQLADRIESLLASERETIADLSHRLRTPMTAIRLDVEALPDSERTRDLARHVEQLDRTLTSVIRNARLPQSNGTRQCDAGEVVRDRVGFWTPLAEDQGRAVSLVAPAVAFEVGCTADELSAALDALLENVVAHTPEGTPLQVELTSVEGGAQLDVVDHGPGIPHGAGMRGRSDRGSTGLGLDIARRCAESTGGSVSLLTGADGSNVVRLFLQGPHRRI
ncbi:MAG: HAMP domain-containing sensor histidine kinase [Aeromicrobium sp.]